MADRLMVLGQTDGFRYIGFQTPLNPDEIKLLPFPLHADSFPTYRPTVEDDGSMTICFDDTDFGETDNIPPDATDSLFVSYAQQTAERLGNISLDTTVRYVGPGSLFSEENLATA